jgi:uncharacterized protein (DUF4415 family)
LWQIRKKIKRSFNKQWTKNTVEIAGNEQWTWNEEKEVAKHVKQHHTRGELMKKATFNPLTPEQLADLEALAALPDDQIDTSDAPEVLDWSGARRGLFYRPIKQQITLRIDADVIAWFKHNKPRGEGYQTDINRVLREYVMQQTTEK